MTVRIVLLLLACVLARVAVANLEVEQPARAFGYFIGDVLTQRINLDTGGKGFQDPELSAAERVGPYLFRLSAALTETEGQRWLELRYQIINTPPVNGTVTLPTLAIKTQAGDERRVEPWPFTIGLLSADTTTPTPLPDRSALAVTGARDGSTLSGALVALSGTLLLWLVWWVLRHLRDARTLPFAKARRTLKRLPQGRPESEADAWIALHRAFDSVADKSISTASVADLFHTAPWLTPRRRAIETFYAASAARFFEQVEAAHGVDLDALCDALYRLEKRQAKTPANVAAA